MDAPVFLCNQFYGFLRWICSSLHSSTAPLHIAR